MHSNKLLNDTHLELGLYIEALLNPEQPEVEVKTEIQEKIDLIASEVEVSVPKIEIKAEEQSQIPLWGQKPFECLLVKSAGMNLILPAMSVCNIERINKKIIRLPLDVEAFRGVVTLRNRSVAVIDLFHLVSENASSNEQSKQVDSHHVEHVIVMENGDYALACDDVGEMITLSPKDIRWNKASFNNPMFSGIVPDYLCPIVDVDSIHKQVAAMPFVQSLNDRNR
jgi:purine-binding chemotaxis protein CheW